MEQKYEYAYAVAEGNTHAQVDWVAMRKKYNEDIGQKLRTVFGARAVRIGQDSHNNIYLHGLLFGPEKKGGHDISAWNKIRDYKNEDGERMLLAVPGANTKDWHYITANIKNMVDPMRVYHLEELFTWTNTYILPRMDIPPQGAELSDSQL